MLVTRGEASACCQEDGPLVGQDLFTKKRHGSTVARGLVDLNSNAPAFPSHAHEALSDYFLALRLPSVPWPGQNDAIYRTPR